MKLYDHVNWEKVRNKTAMEAMDHALAFDGSQRVVSTLIGELLAAGILTYDMMLRTLGPSWIEATGEAVLREGERITCEASHYVGRIGHNIRVGDTTQSHSFTDLQGPEIGSGDAFGLCSCGAWWAQRGSVHTAEGYKPPLVEHSQLSIENEDTSRVLRHGCREKAP